MKKLIVGDTVTQTRYNYDTDAIEYVKVFKVQALTQEKALVVVLDLQGNELGSFLAYKRTVRKFFNKLICETARNKYKVFALTMIRGVFPRSIEGDIILVAHSEPQSIEDWLEAKQHLLVKPVKLKEKNRNGTIRGKRKS